MLNRCASRGGLPTGSMAAGVWKGDIRFAPGLCALGIRSYFHWPHSDNVTYRGRLEAELIPEGSHHDVLPDCFGNCVAAVSRSELHLSVLSMGPDGLLTKIEVGGGFFDSHTV